MKLNDVQNWPQIKKLFELWSLDQKQKVGLLGLSDLLNVKSDIDTIASETDYTDEIGQRVHLLINIDASLKILFNNPKNINGFMKMHNNNSPFKGLMPVELAVKSLNDLKIVEGAISSLILR